VSSCRNATNAFWPDGRLLLPLPVALQTAALTTSPPTLMNPSIKQPPASSAQAALNVVTPNRSEGGTPSQPQRHVASAQPSPAAVMANVAMHVAAHQPQAVSGRIVATAASHGGAAPSDDDPDVPCFDLGI
jgi:hypothetical protein